VNDLIPIDSQQSPLAPPRTPCGRIANTPLRNPKHELVAHAYIQGKTGRDAGLAAGYKDGPGLKGNIARLRQTTEMCERLSELAARSAQFAEIYDGWVLADVALFAKASLARFVKRDKDGNIELRNGLPQLDFSHASEDDYRLIDELSHTKFGPKLKIRDPVNALDKLMRHRGLMRDKVALTDPSGEGPARHDHYLISEHPLSQEEWERQRASAA
jgi:hypothetical protein